jgi:hypothetical protein
MNHIRTCDGFVNIMAILSDLVSKDNPELQVLVEAELTKLLDSYYSLS